MYKHAQIFAILIVGIGACTRQTTPTKPSPPDPAAEAPEETAPQEEATSETPAQAPANKNPSEAPAAPKDDQGFQVLFDGSKTDGWMQAGPGRMVVADGYARTEGGMGLWYYGAKTYKDFILRLQYRQTETGENAGVFVRFPRVDGDPWIPVKEGYEIQIERPEVGDKSTGSVYGFQAATKIPLKPAGEWNDYEIKAVGQRYEIRLNGELINVYQGDRALEGMIGLQNHSDKDTVDFRSVSIKEL